MSSAVSWPLRALRRPGVAGVGIAAMVFGTVLATATPAVADRERTAEAWFVSAINAERVRQGLPALQVADDVTEVAAAWSARMASRGELEHNASFTTEICCWQVVTENVGHVDSIQSSGGLSGALHELHVLFMASSVHRSNILSTSVNEIGVGVHAVDDGLWVTQNFRFRTDASSQPDAAADDATAPPPPDAAAAGDPGAPEHEQAGDAGHVPDDHDTTAPVRRPLDSVASPPSFAWRFGPADTDATPPDIDANPEPDADPTTHRGRRIGPERVGVVQRQLVRSPIVWTLISYGRRDKCRAEVAEMLLEHLLAGRGRFGLVDMLRNGRHRQARTWSHHPDPRILVRCGLGG